MITIGKCEVGNNDALRTFTEKWVESLKQSGEFKEDFFKEDDNTMANNTSWYTTKLAKIIYYKAYDDFKAYFDLNWVLTPADVGSVDGAGVYKIPRVVAARAVKVSSGEVIDYINDGNSSVNLETETFAIGTRINRRLMKRAGAGIIDRLLQAASESVLREVCTDLVTAMIAGINSGHEQATGMSYAAIEAAKKTLKTATNSKGVLFGLNPDFIAFTPLGWYNYSLDNTIQAMVSMGQRNVPGSRLENNYPIVQGLKKVDIDLAASLTAPSNGFEVEAIVLSSKNYSAWLKETEMDVFDGRLPGTPDFEILHVMDAGQVILNDKAAVVITSAS